VHPIQIPVESYSESHPNKSNENESVSSDTEKDQLSLTSINRLKASNKQDQTFQSNSSADTTSSPQSTNNASNTQTAATNPSTPPATDTKTTGTPPAPTTPTADNSVPPADKPVSPEDLNVAKADLDAKLAIEKAELINYFTAVFVKVDSSKEAYNTAVKNFNDSYVKYFALTDKYESQTKAPLQKVLDDATKTLNDLKAKWDKANSDAVANPKDTTLASAAQTAAAA